MHLAETQGWRPYSHMHYPNSQQARCCHGQVHTSPGMGLSTPCRDTRWRPYSHMHYPNSQQARCCHGQVHTSPGMGLSAFCRDTRWMPYSHMHYPNSHQARCCHGQVHMSTGMETECILQRHKGLVHIHTCTTLTLSRPDAVMARCTRVQ